MEIQLTDKENAAFAVFVVLLTRAILSFDLNFYIPLSKVDENMRRGHKRDAVLEGKFWFRRNVFGGFLLFLVGVVWRLLLTAWSFGFGRKSRKTSRGVPRWSAGWCCEGSEWNKSEWCGGGAGGR